MNNFSLNPKDFGLPEGTKIILPHDQKEYHRVYQKKYRETHDIPKRDPAKSREYYLKRKERLRKEKEEGEKEQSEYVKTC